MATKPSLSSPLASSYNPKEVESYWVDFWEKNEFFVANSHTAKHQQITDKFIMVIPPPNVTGSLHIGHGLSNAIEDTLTRWNRMSGKTTLWVPGIDHAGIATQSVVERHILKYENKYKSDFTRQQFVEKVMEWKETYGGKIKDQFKALAISADMSRYAFTMSPSFSKAVTEAFIRMYEDGMIYRANRLVSWSCTLRTALSEIEVSPDEIEKPTTIHLPNYNKPVEVGFLWVFKYNCKDCDDFISVATTRIETMLGDTAVAVNPNDQRFQHLIGKELIHPFINERYITIIADEHVDMDFGTGAVKITPAHDRNDFEIGQRHNLESITIFTLDGKINEFGGKYCGMHRFECRKQIEKDLKNLGLLLDKKPNDKKMYVPRCSRSGDIIEYLLLPQWYIDCKEVAQQASQAVKFGHLQLIPNDFNHIWYHWLDNIKDWCVSRQLWWGHQIPLFLVTFEEEENPTSHTSNSDISEGVFLEEEHKKSEKNSGNKTESQGSHIYTKTGKKTNKINDMSIENEVWIAAHSLEEAHIKTQNKFPHKKFSLKQDEDVLDTWFSSGLFPFAVMGWPDETEDMEAFFPNTLLETGHDIIFFWVARMVMLSLKLTQKLPFSTVFLHPIIRDAHGQKMSKSKGNVIDPLDIINGITLEGLHQKLYTGNLPEKEIQRAIQTQKADFGKGIPECGADALRFGLLAYTNQSKSINLDINRVVGYRHFCNKLWNAVRFALLTFPHAYTHQITHTNTQTHTKNSEHTLQNTVHTPTNLENTQHTHTPFIDQWILHRLHLTCLETNEAFEKYQFSEMVKCTYNFWLYDFCDIYLEAIKPRTQKITKKHTSNQTHTHSKTPSETVHTPNNTIHPPSGVVHTPSVGVDTPSEGVEECVLSDEEQSLLDNIYTCLDVGLRLLHPMIPFITEELYQRLPFSPNKYISITTSPYPKSLPQAANYQLDTEMNLVMKIVRQFRSLLSTLEVHPKTRLCGYIICKEKEEEEVLYTQCELINTLAKMKSVEIISSTHTHTHNIENYIRDVVDDKTDIFIQSDQINFTQVTKKLNKRITSVENLMKNQTKKINELKDSLAASDKIKQTHQQKMEQLQEEFRGLNIAMQSISKFTTT